MIDLIAIITPIALLDSLSMIPVCLVPLIILLSSNRPVFLTLMFLLGIVVVYIPFGIVLSFGFGSTFQVVGEKVSVWINQKPDSIDLLLQFIIGLALLGLGYHIASKRTQQLEQQPKIKVTPVMAFSFAALLVIVGLWGALPYFAAVDQMLRADLGKIQMIIAIIIYNLIFIMPLVILFAIGMRLGPNAKPFLEKIVTWLLRFGKQAITTALYLLGAILIADAIGWYYDYPIIPIGPYA